MANELFNSLRNACLAKGNIVFMEDVGGESGSLERAGICHAIAAFSGATAAKELNPGRNPLFPAIYSV